MRAERLNSLLVWPQTGLMLLLWMAVDWLNSLLVWLLQTNLMLLLLVRCWLGLQYSRQLKMGSRD
jgi:hypothetical protein